MRKIKISPSILSADFSKLGSEIQKPENYGAFPVKVNDKGKVTGPGTDADVSNWNRAQDRMKRAHSGWKEKRARLSTAMDKFNS